MPTAEQKPSPMRSHQSSVVAEHDRRRRTVTGSPFLSAVDRKVYPFSPYYQFKPLSCTSCVFDGVNGHYFSRKTLNYWDKFYKRHQNKVCIGAGNTVFPLVAAYPKLFVHACDFSTEALALIKAHSNFDENRINVFICDVTNEELYNKILPSSVDIVTLIFMLSAVAPNKMPFVLLNLKKPNGHVLVRDYAVGDSAQVKLENRNQKISNNFRLARRMAKIYYR